MNDKSPSSSIPVGAPQISARNSDAVLIPDAAALMREARAETGLQDYGPSDWFVEPLSIEIQSINTEAQLNQSGALIQRDRLVGALGNRLRLFEAIRRNPEILTTNIRVGAVLLALSRSGTTMLHRLLNEVPRITGVTWWESHYPAELEADRRSDVSKRRAAAQIRFDQMLTTIPDLMSIHPMSLDQVDEEITILDQSFMSTTAESFLWLPTYAKWLETADHQPAYDELVLWLRYLQWQDPARAGAVWVLKTPNHIAAISAALKAFPDATFVMTHRDPLRCIPSYCSMVSSLYHWSSDHVDLRAIGQHWQRRWSDALRGLYELRENPQIDARFLDIRYENLTANAFEAAQAVFHRMGLQLTPAEEAALVAHLNDNPRDSRPNHQYSLEKFGLTEESLKDAFSFYRTRMWPNI
jgi:hypothetical protein